MSISLIKKSFRNVVSYESEGIDDVQGTRYKQEQYLYLYFFDHSRASKGVTPVGLHKEFGEFSRISEEWVATRNRNLNRRFEPGWEPSPGIYKISGNKLHIRWEHLDTIVLFKGMVFSNGDTLWGSLFNNGVQVVPARLYHNIEKSIIEPSSEEQLEIEAW